MVPPTRTTTLSLLKKTVGRSNYSRYNHLRKFFSINKNGIIQAFENDIVELNGLELSAVQEIVNYFYTG